MYVPAFRDLSRFYGLCPGVPTTCAKKQNSPGFSDVKKEKKLSTRILEMSKKKRYEIGFVHL